MSDADDRKQIDGSGARKAQAARGADADTEQPAGEESQEPRVCMPCHGTGKVISNLGGLTSKITCPWCRGGGERLTGVDAQEWQQEQAALKRH